VVPTCRCQREGGGLLVVLGRRPDGWAGGLLGCAAERGCRAGRPGGPRSGAGPEARLRAARPGWAAAQAGGLG
jgi:hypothetical protein